MAAENRKAENARSPNLKVHPWAVRLVRHLRGAGVRATDPVLVKGRTGFYSAYFGVPGLGEVRLSDHPKGKSATVDVSISSPSSYLDATRALVFAYNSATGADLVVLERRPYVASSAAAKELLEEIERERVEKAEAAAAKADFVSERHAFWERQVAESGIEGSFKEVKFELKRRGMRYPADNDGVP